MLYMFDVFLLRFSYSHSPIPRLTTQNLRQGIYPLLYYGKLDFNEDPTTVDANFDGQGDWVRRDGQVFSGDTLLGGSWHADATLDTNPASDFAGLTTIEVHMRDTGAGGAGAVFSINADWSGSTAATIYASAVLQEDGSQTLIVYQRDDDGGSTPLV